MGIALGLGKHQSLYLSLRRPSCSSLL